VAWFNEQRERGLSPATLRSRRIALRNFYGWLHEEEELDANPMAKVKVPKKSMPVPLKSPAYHPGRRGSIAATWPVPEEGQ